MVKEEDIKTYKNEALSIADVSNSARYIIIEKSTSAHCCFEYTIVDTKEGKEIYGDYWKRTMCETFEKQEAIEICDALNKHYC
ncbi:MAG: hypothetical protein GY739_18625 [Mesoflavibacter sp.]|nr:hypothetical protein [Mesoflavibacter sp.]